MPPPTFAPISDFRLRGLRAGTTDFAADFFARRELEFIADFLTADFLMTDAFIAIQCWTLIALL